MAFAEYDRYDACGLAALVRRRDVSARELIDAAIARIERHNPRLNAVTFKVFDEARSTADRVLSGGPFKGVPFLIKDMDTPVAGWPMTNGSAFLRSHRSESDCELVRRYRAAGLVLLGRTNAPEFGIPGTTEGRHLGICRNPWNPDHSAGGLLRRRGRRGGLGHGAHGARQRRAGQHPYSIRALRPCWPETDTVQKSRRAR